MTSLPGTQEYMPPEAFEDDASLIYDSKLDIFSFGHLAIFIGIQKLMQLPYSTYYCPERGLQARTELERRMEYVEEMQSRLAQSPHPIIAIIKKCLDNTPPLRPSASALYAQLKDIAPPPELEIKHMEEICRYLNLLSQDNIFDLGLALGISYTSLSDYQESVSSVKQLLRKVIAAWLRKQDYVEERGRIPTWENLVKALRDEQVRQNGIASTISKEKALQQYIV